MLMLGVRQSVMVGIPINITLCKEAGTMKELVSLVGVAVGATLIGRLLGEIISNLIHHW